MSRTTLLPDDDQLRAFLAADLDGAVVMLNLLRFRAPAEPEGTGGGEGSGAGDYARYGSAFLDILAEVGGRIVWSGTPVCTLIGDEGVDTWDQVVLVEYPSRDAFITATSSSRYNEASAHRSKGLEATVLVVCTTDTLSGS